MSKGAPGELASPEVDYSMRAVVTFWSLVFLGLAGPQVSPRIPKSVPPGFLGWNNRRSSGRMIGSLCFIAAGDCRHRGGGWRTGVTRPSVGEFPEETPGDPRRSPMFS